MSSPITCSALLVLVAGSIACASGCAPEGSPSANETQTALVVAELSLIPVSPFASALGHDQRPRFRALLDGQPLDLGPVRSSVEWRGGHVVWSDAGDAWLVAVGAPERLASGVVTSPLVWEDELVLVLSAPGGLTVRRHRRHDVLDTPTELLSLGSLRATADAVVGIGSSNGGVAGYHRVDSSHRCLTNCELRAGRGMQGFVPTNSEFDLHGTQLRWFDGQSIQEIRWAR